jgi:hypothetical protein
MLGQPYTWKSAPEAVLRALLKTVPQVPLFVFAILHWLQFANFKYFTQRVGFGGVSFNGTPGQWCLKGQPRILTPESTALVHFGSTPEGLLVAQ